MNTKKYPKWVFPSPPSPPPPPPLSDFLSRLPAVSSVLHTFFFVIVFLFHTISYIELRLKLVRKSQVALAVTDRSGGKGCCWNNTWLYPIIPEFGRQGTQITNFHRGWFLGSSHLSLPHPNTLLFSSPHSLSLSWYMFNMCSSLCP